MSHALFPFVVMRRDPRGRTPIATLSDDVQLAVVRVTTEGDSSVMFREDLRAAGLDPCAAYLDSRERLVRLVKARLVRTRAVLGPSRVCCLAFEHSFLAASCAVLPDLFDVAQRQLGTDSMTLLMPRRDRLIVAPNLGSAFKNELCAYFGAGDRIFSLDPSGPSWIGKESFAALTAADAMIPVIVESYDDVIERKRCA